MTNRITRLTLAATLALGTAGATLLATAPAMADPGPGRHDGGRGYGYQARYDRDDHARDGWRDRWGHWHAYGRWDRGPRYFDRAHGYWRDRLGYWNPHSGLYVSFHF
jgi:hypothetical protein